MSTLICDIDLEDVGDLRAFLSVLPDDMPISDATGNLLRVRIYEREGVKSLEVK